MPKHFISLAVSALLLTTLFITCFDLDIGSQGEQNETETPILLSNPGLLRPRIDGYLDPGSGNMMAEWQDATRVPVTFQSPTDKEIEGDLWLKSMGPSHYFALELAMPTQDAPTLFLTVKPAGDLHYLLRYAEAKFSIFKGKADQAWADLEEPWTVGDANGDDWLTSDQTTDRNRTYEILFVNPAPETGEGGFSWSLALNVMAETYSFNLGGSNLSRDTFTELDEDGLPLINEALYIPQTPAVLPEPVFDLGLPIDVSVTGLEVTQAVQNADSTLSLVLGKKTLARVFVDLEVGHFSNEVEVILSGFTVSGYSSTPLGSLTKTFTARENPNRSRFDETVNFILPVSWTQWPWLTLQAEVRPIHGLDLNHSDNVIVENYYFKQTYDPVFYVVQVEHWHDGMPDQREIDNMTENLTWVYPVANPQFIQIGPEAIGYWYNNGTQLISELNEVLLSALLNVVLIEALGGDAPPLPDQIFGARVRGGGLSDPVWYGGLSFSSWGSSTASSRELVMAHEVQHNIGPLLLDVDGNGTYFTPEVDEYYGGHIGGCTATDNDEEWDSLYGESDFSVHELGWVPWGADADSNPSKLVPRGKMDLMTYCNDEYFYPAKWISDYRWEKLVDRFQHWERGHPGVTGRGQVSEDSTVRFIRGAVDLKGNVMLHPTFETSGLIPEDDARFSAGQALEGNHNYSIVAKDSLGDVLDTIYLKPSFISPDGEPMNESTFVRVIQDDGNIDSIEFVLADHEYLNVDLELDEHYTALIDDASFYASGKEGRPVEGVAITVSEDGGNRTTTVKTNSTGWAQVNDTFPGEVTYTARRGGELVDSGTYRSGDNAMLKSGAFVGNWPGGSSDFHVRVESLGPGAHNLSWVEIFEAGNGSSVTSGLVDAYVDANNDSQPDDDRRYFHTHLGPGPYTYKLWGDDQRLKLLQTGEFYVYGQGPAPKILERFSSTAKPQISFEEVPGSFLRDEGKDVTWRWETGQSGELTYQLEYSPDNVSWFKLGGPTNETSAKVIFRGFPGSNEGRLRLRATNGFDTAYAYSDTFTLPNQPPKVE